MTTLINPQYGSHITAYTKIGQTLIIDTIKNLNDFVTVKIAYKAKGFLTELIEIYFFFERFDL